MAAQSPVADGPVADLAARHAERCRRLYPPDPHAITTTSLGNALVAGAERIKRRHGLEISVVWPRLYPLLRPEMRQIIDDRRAVLDITIALTGAWTLLAAGWVALLLPARDALAWYGLVPLTAACLSYRATVGRAAAYSEAIDVAIDLGRDALYTALRVPIPTSPADAKKTAHIVNEWLFRDEWIGGQFTPPPPDPG